MAILDFVGIKQDNMIDNAVVEDLISRLSAQANSGQKIVAVANGSLFKVGETVIIYDGDNYFETATIDAINSNNLTMVENLLNSYPQGSMIGKYLGFVDTAGNGKYVRPIAPELGTGSDGDFVSSGNATWSAEKNFRSVLIQSGHIITISGNFEIKCQGTFEIQAGGKINAKGYGHSGGSGGNYGSSGAGNGGGSVYQLKNTGHGGGGAGVASGTDAAGGGGGGYGSNGGDGGYSGSSADRGIGGITYNDAPVTNKTTAYMMGSGGGGGGSALSISGSGGSGGGIIRISCKSFVMAGEIDCDGNNGSDGNTTSYKTGGGGGGAGGTVMIVCLLGAVFGTNLMHARGGTGGQGRNGSTLGYYNGGNGGNGRIRIEAGSLSGTTNPTYATGYSTGASGRTKYGWYITKEIATGQESVMANCIVRQNIVVSPQLSSSASAGQANATVTSASQFEIGDIVAIKENEKMEIKTILNISTNTLTFDSNLANNYTTSAKVNRIDVRGIVSLVLPGEDEKFYSMTMNEVIDIGNNVFEITFSKAVKSSNENTGGARLVGGVLLKGKMTGETTDVSANDINWFWF